MGRASHSPFGRCDARATDAKLIGGRFFGDWLKLQCSHHFVMIEGEHGKDGADRQQEGDGEDETCNDCEHGLNFLSCRCYG